MYASRGGHYNCLKLLLLARADPNAATENGQTSLMFAARNYDAISTLEALVNCGANPNLRTPTGWTATMLSTKYRQEDNLKKLLACSADPNMEADGGWTAILFCAKYGSAAEMQILLDNDGEVNVQNAQGWTAIMLSIKYGDREKLKTLLAAGGNPDLRSRKGRTAVHFCVKCERPGHLKILLEKPGHYVLNERQDLSQIILSSTHLPSHLCLLLAYFLMGNVNVDCKDVDGIFPLEMATAKIRESESSTQQVLSTQVETLREVEKILKKVSSLDNEQEQAPPVVFL